MSEQYQWQLYMGKRRRRSARKSGGKKTKTDVSNDAPIELNNESSESVSVSETVSAIHEANETLDSHIDSLLNDNMANYQNGLPGTNMIPFGQPPPGQVLNMPIVTSSNTAIAGSTTTTMSASRMMADTSTTTIHNFPMTNQTVQSNIGQTQQFCAFSVPPPNNGAASFNASESNLSHMGVTDGSTALILGEIQAMRAAIVGELGAKFSADIQKMHDDIVQGFSGRFQRIEDKVAKMEEEHVKFQ